MKTTMPPSELRELIQRFLSLIEGGAGTEEWRRAELAELLDRLAMATHLAPEGSVSDPEVDSPCLDDTTLRRLVRSRFPDYGFYVFPSLMETPVLPEPLMGDSADDIADIAIGLYDVAWTWDHVGVEDGLWLFHFTFRSNWGRNLRGLQSFLYLQDPAGGWSGE